MRRPFRDPGPRPTTNAIVSGEMIDALQRRVNFLQAENDSIKKLNDLKSRLAALETENYRLKRGLKPLPPPKNP